MSRVVPSQFETDMARLGKRIGDPIPRQLKTRPEPGEYGGFYDEKTSEAKPVEAPIESPSRLSASPPSVEQRQSEPKPAAQTGSYQTRASTAAASTAKSERAKDA